MPSTIEQTKAAVDAAARSSGFRCVPVSWEDASRGKSAGGALSTMGPNIADVRLYEKTGALLYTLRSQNWNERLGYVAAGDVALMTGNESPSASALQPTTLASYLQNVGTHARYAGVAVPSLYEPTIDGIFSIRFQTVFLPVAAERGGAGGGAPPSTEFCTEVYSYQTHDSARPRNMLLLATPQGVSVQQDAVGRAKVFFHSVAPGGAVHRYWLEAEKSEKQVGGAQVETRDEALAAAARGKSTAVRIGPSSMGTRFNVQMLIQVPLKNRSPTKRVEANGKLGTVKTSFAAGAAACAESSGDEGALDDDSDESDALCAVQYSMSSLRCCAPARAGCAKPAVGTSNAARVSRGSEHDVWGGVANKKPERDAAQHGTITVTMYYTVVGGVPSAEDVMRACADLDALYKQCPSDKRLVKCDEVTSTGGVVGGSLPKTLPTAPAKPSPAALCKAICPGGHTLSPVFGGEYSEPENGWWCDGCGLYTPKGAPLTDGRAKGFACRGCDFDVCARCASGPLCGRRHPLVRLAPPSGGESDVVTCGACLRKFAALSGTFWGCGCGAGTSCCTECYVKIAVK